MVTDAILIYCYIPRVSTSSGQSKAMYHTQLSFVVAFRSRTSGFHDSGGISLDLCNTIPLF